MPIFQIPKVLQQHTDNNQLVNAVGATVSDALANLVQLYPGLQAYFVTTDNEFGAFFNIYLNGKDVRFIQGLATPVTANDVLKILFSLAGG